MLCISEQELVISTDMDNNTIHKVYVADDRLLPVYAETVVPVHIISEISDGMARIVELGNQSLSNKGMLIGQMLVRLGEEKIPV